MSRPKIYLASLLLFTLLPAVVLAQSATWDPTNPDPGDVVTITYDANIGTIPASTSSLKLHWGINQSSQGNWEQPPESIWPEGSVPWSDNLAVQSPMVDQGEGVWQISISTHEEIETLHFVVTNGTAWDNNSESNWNINFGDEPPPPTWTTHRFVYDSRSAFAQYRPEDIPSIYAAGEFNEWNTSATPLAGPDSRGVYSAEVQVPTGDNSYKFVINDQGNTIWMQDPDNPLDDGTEYGNSYFYAERDTIPWGTIREPHENAVFPQGDPILVEGRARRADDDVALESAELTIDGDALDVQNFTFDAVTGEFSAELLTEDSFGSFRMELTVTDTEDRVGSTDVVFGVNDDSHGFIAVDRLWDATGSGEYMPPGEDGPPDLRRMTISSVAEGDSLRFQTLIANHSTDTRLLIQINSHISLPFVASPLAATEISSPEWNGRGVQMLLADPEAEDLDPNRHNVLATQRMPLVTQDVLDVRAAVDFTVAVADIEAVLGSYSGEWYYSAYTFLEGPEGTVDGSWEVDAEHGGSVDINDPDGFDVLFTDDLYMQQTLFANWTNTHHSTIDNVGRGFAAILPSAIGPDVGNDAPSVSFITRSTSTVRDTKTLYMYSPDPSLIIRIDHTWDEGSTTYTTAGNNGQFTRDVTLHPGNNDFQMWTVAEGDTSFSSVISIFHKTPQAPDVVMNGSVDGSTITLDASSSTDPQEQEISYSWTPDPDNPAVVSLTGMDSPTATFQMPELDGEYYFDLVLEDSEGNQGKGRTFVTVEDGIATPFDLNMNARWVQDAIVYEIFVRSYNTNHQISAVTADLDRIAELGVTAIWFMPIFPGPTTHGYAITDYREIEEDYGDLDDFAELVEEAHARGIKVVLDLVINHTAIEHPWMQDAIAMGEASNTYDYYDRDANGDHTYYYDWYTLPNLNFDNPDVWDYFLETSKWWVENYNVDGYRCDVAWGVQERDPDFWVEWRRQLKTIKPEIYLLGEADATDFAILNNRFDSAYDWPLHHADRNSFVNLFSNTTVVGLHSRITNMGFPFPDYRFPFRFMENHDEGRYRASHSLTETGMAATMLLTIPGVPMIYAGQEVGEQTQRDPINWSQDDEGLLGHYKTLIEARRRLPSMSDPEQINLPNDQNGDIYSYGRYAAGEHPVFVALNIDDQPHMATIDLSGQEWGIQPDETYYVSELLTRTSTEVLGSELDSWTVDLPIYGDRVFVISDTLFEVSAPEERAQPLEWSLDANYPNPFNPSTTIRYTVPQTANVKLAVYNLLGQRVATLVDGNRMAGRHSVVWNGTSLGGLPVASGLYFYTLEGDGFVQTRKMLLVK
ncbi:T9SS type A sorting domain-containing protein [bacterium]|nr:T9SS type A sorting domain-containing protein [bacterium]